MKLGIKCFIALVVALMASLCVSASDTTTKFKTGPFTGSVDLGMSCDDINISKPVQGEWLSGLSYTGYDVKMCGVYIEFYRYDNPTLDLNANTFGTSITSSLLSSGANKDTISLYDREINSKSGAVGSGYIPKYDYTKYMAGFYVSPKSYCYISIWDNETKMVSALKTINVTEAAT